VAEAGPIPGRNVAVNSGEVVVSAVGGIWRVLVAVGMASMVWVCNASAVDAICVKISAESTVGVGAKPPTPQAERPSKARAVRSQNIFIRRFMRLILHF
jgi:hypothetical protein